MTDNESKKFIPSSELNWNDCTNEAYREYVYRDGSIYRIDAPQRVAVKAGQKGDSHRVVAETMDHYIAPGWIAIRWTGKDGKSAHSW